MRDFPSCFGENGVQIADSSSSSNGKSAHNSVICIYKCQMNGISCWVTITWFKNLMGQGLSIGIDDHNNHCLCKIDIKPWLFSKRKGYRNVVVVDNSTSNPTIIDIYWDLSSAKFGSGPEPVEGFYLGLVCNNEMVLLLGDIKKEDDVVYKKLDFCLVAKREHISGKKCYSAKAQFCGGNGLAHDVVIECDTAVGIKDPCLVIRIDGKTVIMVKRLRWKFRGNHTILVDGLPVEVFWDVHNWLFGNVIGSAVFMFQTCLSTDKVMVSQPVSDHSLLSSWSHNNLQRFGDYSCSQSHGLGFSLILYAWKNE